MARRKDAGDRAAVITNRDRNLDQRTVDGFGKEWQAYDQSRLPAAELHRLFDAYFSAFPFDELEEAEGFDLGCGSGRWARLAAPQVKRLHCIDPSPDALQVAGRNLAGLDNVEIHLGCADSIPLDDHSQCFGYCLGVLHSVPDPQAALDAAVRKLKAGAPFLLYLYYALENRPVWFRGLWRATDLLRRLICRLPFPARRAVTSAIALTVYWPLARLSHSTGLKLPLAYYGALSFYTMRTDALDRFGTRLEQRFSRTEVREMMERAGLVDIRFNEAAPFWVAWGRKRDMAA